MLPIRLGTFLTEQESNQAKYYFNKPLIRLTAAAFMVFSVSLAASMGAAATYAHICKPSPVVSESEYKQAQALAASVTKHIATLKEAHPKDIDVCNVVYILSTAAKAQNIAITDVNIAPGSFTIKGQSPDIKKAHSYLQALDFGSKYTKQIKDISGKDDRIQGVEFTISIDEKKSVKPKQPAKAVQAKGGKQQ